VIKSNKLVSLRDQVKRAIFDLLQTNNIDNFRQAKITAGFMMKDLEPLFDVIIAQQIAYESTGADNSVALDKNKAAILAALS
jgi:hypothetical protein